LGFIDADIGLALSKSMRPRVAKPVSQRRVASAKLRGLFIELPRLKNPVS